MKKWLDIIQSVVVIAGVVIALYQLDVQTQTLVATKEIESGKFVLEFSRNLEADRYDAISSAIEDHDENFHILKTQGGKFSASDLEAYIGIFESIGELETRKLIDLNMAHNEFSYPVEKAWCNRNIRSHIDEVRRQSSYFFINFETLAHSFLKKDKIIDCRNLS